MNIRDHVRKAISDGLEAEFTQQNGVPGILFHGILFHDGNEFVPFDDLNYNSQYGYYRLSQLPDVERDCTNENPETIHWGKDFHEWKPLIWADDGGFLHLVGEEWQAADLYQALGHLLLHGKADPEEISEDDWAWDYMKKIDWAVSEYRTIITDDSRSDEKIANTIRAAASAGRIHGVSQGESGNWYFNPARYRGWLVKTRDEKRGRPRKTEDSIFVPDEDFDGDTVKLQHQLAEMTRQATGSIPRGQLWQPCEEPGCDNEPVCLNCMKCQEKHCHCFDEE